MEQNKQIQFQMKISSINVLGFSQYAIDDKIEKSSIEYQSDFELQLLPETGEIHIKTTVKIKIKDSDKIFGELKTLVKFHIIPFDSVVIKEAEGFRLPDDLTLNLFNIVIGSIRGILHERLRGTILHDEVFPLMDLNQLLKGGKL